MSQWEKIQFNNELYADIYNYYNSHQFPLEVRVVLRNWLEYHVFNSQLDPDNPEHGSYFKGFVGRMLDELRKEIRNITGNDNQSQLFRYNLQHHAAQLQQRFHDPSALFRTIKLCLEHEQREISRFENNYRLQHQQVPLSGQIIPQPQSPFISLKNRLDEILSETNQISKLNQSKSAIKKIEGIVEDLGVNRQHLSEIEEAIQVIDPQPNGHQNQLRRLQLQSELQAYISAQRERFVENMTCLLLYIQEGLGLIQTIQQEVFHELDLWKIEQRKLPNGFPMTKNIDELEELTSKVASALMKVYNYLKQAERYQQNEMVHGQYPDTIFQCHIQLKTQTKGLLQSLITKSFVVEKQPNQILHSKSSAIKPPIKLRLLVGLALNRHFTSQVKVSLIDEEEAKKHYHNTTTYIPNPKIKLSNDEKVMGMLSDNGPFGVEFSGIKLPSIPHGKKSKNQSADNQGEQENQSVAEEKFCFYFRSMFSFMEHTFQLQVTSNPVTITCHPSQDPIAWGTIFWDSAFAESNRIPFKVPLSVPWEHLIQCLDYKFIASTGRGFTESNKQFLFQKLQRNALSNRNVSWDCFFREPLEGYLPPPKAKGASRFASFTSWIFAIMKLCERIDEKAKLKDNLLFQKFWMDGRIEGFIDREDMKIKLRNSVPETFMLRFSDTVLGAVTVNWYNKETGEVEKYMPYTIDEFRQIPLGNRLLKKHRLKFLYPNIPKADVFSEVAVLDQSKTDLMLKGYFLRSVQETTDENLLDRTRCYSSQSLASQSSPSPQTSGSTSSQYSPSSQTSGSTSRTSAFSPLSAESQGSSNMSFGYPERSHEGGPLDFCDLDFESVDFQPQINRIHEELDFYSVLSENSRLAH